MCRLGCLVHLWGVYTIQQTSSKCIQNTRANAGRLLDRVNTLLRRPVEKGGKGRSFFPGSTFGGPTVAQRYKVYQNAPS